MEGTGSSPKRFFSILPSADVLGNIPGSMGETSALLILLAGVYLVFIKTASWKTIVSVLAGVGCVGLRDLYYLDEMKAFEEKIPGFRFVPALSGAKEEDNWTGETGLITEVVDRYITDGSNAEAYLCGSPGMINACIKVLHSKGITDDRIFYDKF